MKRRVLTFTLILLLGFVSTTLADDHSHGGMVYSNGSLDANDAERIIYCQYDEYYGWVSRLTDDWTIFADGNIDGLAWLGGWDSTVGTYHKPAWWDIEIYTELNDLPEQEPGSPYWTIEVPADDVTDEFQGISGIWNYHRYECDLPTDFAFQAGVTYWLVALPRADVPPRIGSAAIPATDFGKDMAYASEYFGWPDWTPDYQIYSEYYRWPFELYGTLGSSIKEASWGEIKAGI